MQVIEVAATVIAVGNEIMMVYNPGWHAFTLPMTKVRSKPLGLVKGRRTRELWSDAAMRNVGECLGRTLDIEPKLLMDVKNIEQSDRTGDVNYYHFQLYLARIDSKESSPGVVADWLKTSDILDEQRGPISSTARELARHLEANAAHRGVTSPPAASNEASRKSEAVVAIISRKTEDPPSWLVQWNEKWQRYYLIGGHREDKEAATQCLERELHEELSIEPADYQTDVLASEPAKYQDWSVGSWQTTDYVLWPFRVTLSPDAVKKVGKDAANRWITEREIRAERCDDGQLISPATRKTLEMLQEI
jgi:8-oxo-dGTP pyrophosphatase MutT (NUDIX family)